MFFAVSDQSSAIFYLLARKFQAKRVNVRQEKYFTVISHAALKSWGRVLCRVNAIFIGHS